LKMGAAVAFPQPVVNWPLVKSGVCWAKAGVIVVAAAVSNSKRFGSAGRTNDGQFEKMRMMSFLRGENRV